MTEPDHSQIIDKLDKRLDSNDEDHVKIGTRLTIIETLLHPLSEDVSSVKRWLVTTVTSVLLLGVGVIISTIIANHA